jgi:uncharacterized membrane-anchored protein
LTLLVCVRQTSYGQGTGAGFNMLLLANPAFLVRSAASLCHKPLFFHLIRVGLASLVQSVEVTAKQSLLSIVAQLMAIVTGVVGGSTFVVRYLSSSGLHSEVVCAN